MMGPGDGYPGHVHPAHHHPSHHPMPMDLHVPQGFPYYRYRNEAFCWPERKPGVDDMTAPGPMNARDGCAYTCCFDDDEDSFDKSLSTHRDFHQPHKPCLKLAGPWGGVPGLGTMLPYGAVMDYAVAAGQFHPRQSPVNPAFTHSCILELRKEKSRDAARSRRGKENYEFYELAKMLPLPPAITSQLDKASIIRLTISYLRLKDFSSHGEPPWNRDSSSTSSKKGSVRPRPSGNVTLDLFEQHQGTHILQSLDGFAFALAADGRFLYISETVSIYLGLSQVEMTGSSVFDYIHQQDHAELAEQLGLVLAHGPGANVPSPAGSEDNSSSSATNNPDVSSVMSLSSTSANKGLDRAFCIRMKSTLTKRGCHFKSSGYRVVLVISRFRPQYSFSHTRKSPPPLLGMVALAIALPPPSVHEIRLETDMFVTRLTFDFRVVHCEPRVAELLEYTPEEMTGRNLYAICHAEDVSKLRKCHVDLLGKGQAMSQYYRLMNKNGGYTWLQTCATVVCNSKNSDEQSIICVNYIISGKEYSHLVMDCCQLEQELPPTVKREVLTDDNDRKSPDQDSSDGNGPGRDGLGGPYHHDSSKSPGARSGAGSDRSPDIRDSCAGRERRAPNAGLVHQRSTSNRLSDEAKTVLPESQPLTPISTSTSDHPRTPQSVRSLDSEPMIAPPPAAPVSASGSGKSSGRKRKLDRANAAASRMSGANSASIDESISAAAALHMEGSRSSRGHAGGSSSSTVASNSHSSPCANKRQIIVQNEMMESPLPSSTQGHGVNGNSGHESGASPHTNSDTDNSVDASRWRKAGSHSQAWDASGGSSVKDLEQVMSKHLGRDGDQVAPIVTSGIDFSADSLLRQPAGSRAGSAIQWVGAGAQSGPGLPVSALLRQLCASRESVIRANVQAAAAAAVVAARGAGSYYPDMSTVQSALPTPPGSDTYGSESQFMLSSHQKTASASDFPSLVPYSSVSSYDYQSAMTPPASVSPRDKPSYTSDPGNGYGDAATNTSFRPPQSYLDGPAQPLPLKPVYGYHPHSALESQYGNPLTDHSQSQFYPPPHTGFHLYHPGKPTPYGDLKNANWYSTAS